MLGGGAGAVSGVSRLGSVAAAAGAPLQLLWPMLFITIACGACSGFHSLIASGTTSKQLKNEDRCQGRRLRHDADGRRWWPSSRCAA